jgi:hypothetical protein
VVIFTQIKQITKTKEIIKMMTTGQASYYFTAGYRFFIGSYYGESLATGFEEVCDALTIEESDDWLYVESVEVDDTTREVHIFIGNDE